MKRIFEQNKTVIYFLATFIGCYLILAGIYQAYLTYATSEIYYPEYITYLVSEQSAAILRSWGYDVVLSPHPNEPSVRLALNKNYLVRIIEGCNAVSVLILFVSFVLAFKSTWKKTLLFIFTGSVLIYGMNIIRIALLCVGIYHYPELKELLHGTVFPAVIYGSVFLLWIIWVRIVTKQKKNEAT